MIFFERIWRRFFHHFFLWLFIFSCSHKPPIFWPQNGYSFLDTQWTVSLEDSASVLRLNGGVWILPQPPLGVTTRTTLTRHVHPLKERYRRWLGRADQESVRDEGSILREFYQFERGGVFLLGYESRDSTRLLTVYNPPLLLVPNNIDRLDTTVVLETVSRVWNVIADTFKTEPKTRIRLILEKRGSVRLDSATVPAVLCRMAISQDGAIGFGGKDLIVPDAVMVENRVLFAQGIGPVLEWGVRSAMPEPDAMRGHSSIREPDRMDDKPSLYIEVVLHKRNGI
jgi:hypothetical protein